MVRDNYLHQYRIRIILNHFKLFMKMNTHHLNNHSLLHVQQNPNLDILPSLHASNNPLFYLFTSQFFKVSINFQADSIVGLQPMKQC